MKNKQFNAGFKSFGEDGTATVVFATLETIDHDGDWIEKGAIGNQTVKVVGAHDWKMAPIGVAKLYESGNEAIAEIQFNLEMESAKEWYQSIKFSKEQGAPQEYSFGFEIPDGTWERAVRDSKSCRVLKSLPTFEVSPVMRGAGKNTRTLSVKNRNDADGDTAKAYVQLAGSWEETQTALQSVLHWELLGDLEGYICIEGTYADYVIASRYIWDNDEPVTYWKFNYTQEGGVIVVSDRQQITLTATVSEKGIRLSEHPGRVLAALLELETRTKAASAARAKEGRTLSRATRDELSKATEKIRDASARIDALLAESDKPAEKQRTTSEADRAVLNSVLEQLQRDAARRQQQ
jgi:hypothetical protein